MCILIVFFSSGRRHTSCALGTGFQTCVLPICPFPPDYFTPIRCVLHGARHRGCCCMEFAASVCPIFAPRCAGRHGGANAASAEYHHQRVTGRRVPPVPPTYRAPASDGLGLAAAWRAWRDRTSVV